MNTSIQFARQCMKIAAVLAVFGLVAVSEQSSDAQPGRSGGKHGGGKAMMSTAKSQSAAAGAKRSGDMRHGKTQSASPLASQINSNEWRQRQFPPSENPASNRLMLPTTGLQSNRNFVDSDIHVAAKNTPQRWQQYSQQADGDFHVGLLNNKYPENMRGLSSQLNGNPVPGSPAGLRAFDHIDNFNSQQAGTISSSAGIQSAQSRNSVEIHPVTSSGIRARNRKPRLSLTGQDQETGEIVTFPNLKKSGK